VSRVTNHVLQDEETRAAIVDAAHRIQGLISRTAPGAPDGRHATAERKWLRGLIRRAATKAWIAGHDVGNSQAHDPVWCRHLLSLVDAKDAQNAAATPVDASWCYATNADAETWTAADSREDAIARGRLDYDGAPFVIARGRPVAPTDLRPADGRWVWENALDNAELPEQALERLAPTDAELADLTRRLRATFDAWAAPVCARARYSLVEGKAEEIRP
jgi:hypothetical protein